MTEDRLEVENGLLAAMSCALEALDGGADSEGAVRRSVRIAAHALGAERALLLGVNAQRELGDLVCAQGVETVQVQELRAGRPSAGVSAAVIRRVLESGRTVHLQVADVADGSAREDPSLETAGAVVCIPVGDRSRSILSGLLYLQIARGAVPLQPDALAHVQAYAVTLGQVWRSRREDVGGTATAGVVGARRASAGHDAAEILGDSESIVELRSQLKRVIVPAMGAVRPDPILILGPTGTGKEVVARYLHAASERARGRFVALNCATFRGEILEAKLFGHVRGAYTGAVGDSEGLFVAAHGGVLFLDEVGDMPDEGQGLLLRALETRRVRAVGGRDERQVDVQLVCATNVDLERAVRARRFRSDLYHRIKGLSVRLPPLCERTGDVRLLLSHFLAQHEARLGKRTRGLTQGALDVLERYDWPGNVRELNQACSSLVMYADAGGLISETVLAQALPDILGAVTRPPSSLGGDLFDRPFDSLRDATRAFEREYLLHVQRRFRDNRSEMARQLQLDRKSLWRRMVRAGLIELGRGRVDESREGDGDDSDDEE